LDDETWRLGAMCKNLGRVRIWGQRTKVKVTGTKNEKKNCWVSSNWQCIVRRSP